MRKALEARLAPTALDVMDESSRHEGHAGARPEGETHFRVRIVSPRFEGLSRVARQRLVNEALSEEFASGLHALAMELRTPAEAAA
ncbi:MAG TPA: BolA family protein [Caulobacterales bacterium]|nr:BolA family protein [Caulobacterales bacterium]